MLKESLNRYKSVILQRQRILKFCFLFSTQIVYLFAQNNFEHYYYYYYFKLKLWRILS